jgi:hypothetical protein
VQGRQKSATQQIRTHRRMQHHCSDTIHEAMVSSSMRHRLPRLNMKRQIMALSNSGIEGICHRPKEKPIVSSAISDPNCATISGLVSTRFFEKPTDHASCGRNGALIPTSFASRDATINFKARYTTGKHGKRNELHKIQVPSSTNSRARPLYPTKEQTLIS